jgi:Holliday junction resolvase RusA-like endonuclease
MSDKKRPAVVDLTLLDSDSEPDEDAAQAVLPPTVAAAAPVISSAHVNERVPHAVGDFLDDGVNNGYVLSDGTVFSVTKDVVLPYVPVTPKRQRPTSPTGWKHFSPGKFLTHGSKCVHFTVNGAPKPKQAAAFSKGHYWNPSRVLMEELNEAARYTLRLTGQLGLSKEMKKHPHTHICFGKDKLLVMTIVARFPRPKCHFPKNKPRMPNDDTDSPPPDLLPGTPTCVNPMKVDCDNITKFIQDAFNLSLYEDDSQVINCSTYKAYDNSGDCSGYININIRRYKEDGFARALANVEAADPRERTSYKYSEETWNAIRAWKDADP